jgi:hypothetical protein
MNTRRAGHTLVLVVGLLLAGMRPAVAGSEAHAAAGGAQAAAARIEAMAHLLAQAPRLSVTTTWCRTRGRSSSSASGAR